MRLDLALVGERFDAPAFRYRWQDVVQYALGIGATTDELEYLYEGVPGGLRTYPSFAVVPAYPAVGALLARLVADPSRLVHGGQRIRLHRPLPAEAEVDTTATLRGLYDLKKLCEIDIAVETREAGELLCETEWSLYLLGVTGQGRRRPARSDRGIRVPRDRPADWSVELSVRPEQAVLYRLSGDTNPLHVDPAVARHAGFEQGPVLHGLCTLGFATRALVWQEAHGDGSLVREMGAQFRRPVWPGDQLQVAGYRLGQGRVAIRVTASGRPDPVLSDCYGELVDGAACGGKNHGIPRASD